MTDVDWWSFYCRWQLPQNHGGHSSDDLYLISGIIGYGGLLFLLILPLSDD